jgi:kynurenine formamidase
VIVETLANLDQVPDEFTFAGFPLNFKAATVRRFAPWRS